MKRPTPSVCAGTWADDASCAVSGTKDGNDSLPFNRAGMYRGVVTQHGALRTAIYEERLAERML